jgi:hypothetical protein
VQEFSAVVLRRRKEEPKKKLTNVAGIRDRRQGERTKI